MQQYREIKARHPGTLLFFRMGDFYEMFEDDARLAARELGLTLTARNNGGAADVPLAGVPVKAATEYLRRLIALGHRVAICEQVEDPKLAKGLVRREVIETVTPGTVLAEEWLERKRDRKSTRLNSSHSQISYAVFCLKKKKTKIYNILSGMLRSDDTFIVFITTRIVHRPKSFTGNFTLLSPIETPPLYHASTTPR